MKLLFIALQSVSLLSMEIRKIQENETKEALALMAKCFPPSYSSIFFINPEHTFVAIDDGKIIGGMNIDLYEAKVKMGYMGWLYVDENYRGSGIGQSLLDAAIAYLDDEADIICGCIEGDNPSSFKNLANRPGFSIMPLTKQFKVFGLKTFKVWKKASRFFDMGYFMWHKEAKKNKCPKSLNPSFGKQALSFSLTVLFNTLFFALSLLLWKSFTISSLAIPIFVLSIRTTIQAIVFRIRKVTPIYLGWDTAWLSSILSIALPFYFPTPGGVYPKGKDWNLRDMKDTLSLAGLAMTIVEALLLLLGFFNRDFISFTLLLFISDSLLSFYPFCGFSASRIYRGKKKTSKIILRTLFILFSLGSLLLFVL